MGLFTRDIKTMNDLFVHQLQDIYYAEKQLVKALPKMAEKAANSQLGTDSSQCAETTNSALGGVLGSVRTERRYRVSSATSSFGNPISTKGHGPPPCGTKATGIRGRRSVIMGSSRRRVTSISDSLLHKNRLSRNDSYYAARSDRPNHRL